MGLTAPWSLAGAIRDLQEGHHLLPAAAFLRAAAAEAPPAAAEEAPAGGDGAAASRDDVSQPTTSDPPAAALALTPTGDPSPAPTASTSAGDAAAAAEDDAGGSDGSRRWGVSETRPGGEGERAAAASPRGLKRRANDGTDEAAGAAGPSGEGGPSPKQRRAGSPSASSPSGSARGWRCVRCSASKTPQWRPLGGERCCNRCYVAVKRGYGTGGSPPPQQEWAAGGDDDGKGGHQRADAPAAAAGVERPVPSRDELARLIAEAAALASAADAGNLAAPPRQQAAAATTLPQRQAAPASAPGAKAAIAGPVGGAPHQKPQLAHPPGPQQPPKVQQQEQLRHQQQQHEKQHPETSTLRTVADVIRDLIAMRRAQDPATIQRYRREMEDPGASSEAAEAGAPSSSSSVSSARLMIADAVKILRRRGDDAAVGRCQTATIGALWRCLDPLRPSTARSAAPPVRPQFFPDSVVRALFALWAAVPRRGQPSTPAIKPGNLVDNLEMIWQSEGVAEEAKEALCLEYVHHVSRGSAPAALAGSRVLDMPPGQRAHTVATATRLAGLMSKTVCVEVNRSSLSALSTVPESNR